MENVSVKNGLIEGVSICFYKNGKILLEDRGKGFINEAIFPSGKIEEKDKLSKTNYHEVALKREVFEEFDGLIELNKYKYLGEIISNEHNVIFYIYLITDFNGTFPNAIKEEGKTDSLIEFFEIKDAYKLLNNKSAIKTLDLIVKNIK